MVIYLLLFPPVQVTLLLLLIALIAGLSLALGYVLVLKSLETEQTSNTWALINLAYISIVIFGVFGLGEAVTLPQVAAILIIFLGAGFVTINRGFKFNKHLIPAIAGNLLWVVYNILMIYGISKYPTSPSLIISAIWIIGFVSLLVYGIASSRTKSKQFKRLITLKLTLPLITFIGVGLVLGLGQILFVLVILQKFVAIGGAILAIEPIVIVIAAYLIYKDKMTTFQKAGVIITVIGGIIISLL
jgi:drug/metabolite transporter (DMT)-like permease